VVEKGFWANRKSGIKKFELSHLHFSSPFLKQPKGKEMRKNFSLKIKNLI
jgi:hypothetical protein